MQIFPSAVLYPYIKHYLFIEICHFKHNQLRIFADGNTGIVFCLGDGMLFYNGEKLPQVFIYGQIPEYKNLEVRGSVSLVITVFRPFGLSRILDIPATAMTNMLIDYEVICGSAATDLHEQLSLSKGKYNIVENLNSYFSILINNNEMQLHPMIPAATNWILEKKGIFKAEELVNYTGYQQRTIERIFKSAVGLSPKKLAGIIRLHHFLGKMHNTKSENNLTEIVYDAGYYDQAHLIRDFHKFVGLTPSAYQLKHGKLAVNVVDLPVENIQSQVKNRK
ncbi:helix-turn-helix domain-containing protein [Chryseobacterium sp. CFS15]|uniref:AraC family transcriptional regulator n=1 Tax=Chryseobacterium sp. CFS15 TaxID=2986946 RepID=UPI00280696C3|nr:helix-turn-helix domain-containing protein [Chryseobacterium sp. CFS15]MDQ8141440.1 helix-turn-helix domain-containing protein [Chryseobacterium sp. CFS15]